MAKIQKALLMTVGVAPEESREDLARTLLKSINSANPDIIYFFGSSLSRDTVKKMEEIYSDDPRFSLDFYEFIEVNEVDSFEKYYKAFKSQIIKLKNDYNLVIDFTSGTKTMIISAAIVSMLAGIELFHVSGKREADKIIMGTEKVVSQNFYLVYDEMVRDYLMILFNLNRFDSAKLLVKQASDNFNKSVYMDLFNAYSAFDNVDYERALEFFNPKSFNKEWPMISKQLIKNRKALGIINDTKNSLSCKYILASLLNNAKRRASEQKYDDAIARLYRSLELIAQIKLKAFGLITSNIDLEILKSHGVDTEYYETLRDPKSGHIKISLLQDFRLLVELDDDIGKFFKQNESKIYGSLSLRNNSILAHGLVSKTREDYESFSKIVLDMANALDKDMGKFLDHTKFPIFDDED